MRQQGVNMEGGAQKRASYHRRRATVKAVRILLIEDCKSDVYIVEKMLQDAAINEIFEITSVPRLVDAFHVLDGGEFDLILLDLNLLDIDGVASVAALHAECPYIPLVVYSGSVDTRLRSDALMCGAQHYLVKGRESGYSLRFIINSILATSRDNTH